MTNIVHRFPLPMAYIDPAFRRCLDEAISEPEFVEHIDRLYGTSISKNATAKDMRAFAEHVHDVIYMRLADEAILGLRLSKPIHC